MRTLFILTALFILFSIDLASGPGPGCRRPAAPAPVVDGPAGDYSFYMPYIRGEAYAEIAGFTDCKLRYCEPEKCSSNKHIGHNSLVEPYCVALRDGAPYSIRVSRDYSIISIDPITRYEYDGGWDVP